MRRINLTYVLGLIVEAREEIAERLRVEVRGREHARQDIDMVLASRTRLHPAPHKRRRALLERQQVVRPARQLVPPFEEVPLVARGRIDRPERRPPRQALKLVVPFVVVDLLPIHKRAARPIDARTAKNRRMHILVAAEEMTQRVIRIQTLLRIDRTGGLPLRAPRAPEIVQQFPRGQIVTAGRRRCLDLLQPGIIQIEERQYADDAESCIVLCKSRGPRLVEP